LKQKARRSFVEEEEFRMNGQLVRETSSFFKELRSLEAASCWEDAMYSFTEPLDTHPFYQVKFISYYDINISARARILWSIIGDSPEEKTGESCVKEKLFCSPVSGVNRPDFGVLSVTRKP
jgi:hypothetical protein